MDLIDASIRPVVRFWLTGLILVAPTPILGGNAPNLSLSAFGAVGDNQADDTQALQTAFRKAGGRCLDGDGRTFRVRGTLRVETDFCLANARLRQDTVPFDTRPWIKGDCPIEKDAEQLADCGDPAMPSEVPAGLEDVTL